MVDVKSFLSALKIGWLKRILCDNGKNYKDFFSSENVSINTKKKKLCWGICKCNHAESKKEKKKKKKVL